MIDFTDLIARLEAAEGPSRELDGHIHAFVQDLEFNWPGKEKDEFGNFIWCFRNPRVANGPGAMFTMASCPLYTASVDAALTLVPEGSDWSVGYIHANGFVSANVMWQAEAGSRFHEFFDVGPETVVWWGEHGKALTPALAICIASFKAKQISIP